MPGSCKKPAGKEGTRCKSWTVRPL